MKQNKLKSSIQKLTPQKRRAGSEVISSLLLVAITVVGAVILTTFIDDAFVSGSLAVTSGTDVTIKSIKVRAYDTRDGDTLMGYPNLDNGNALTPQVLCRLSCFADPDDSPVNGGSDFLVIQIENRGLNLINLKNVYLDNVEHGWDPSTSSQTLNIPGGEFPADGTYSILSDDVANLVQHANTQIQGGETFNLLVKLDTTNPDIELSKTIRVQLNIGASTLAELLIESGGAQ